MYPPEKKEAKEEKRMMKKKKKYISAWVVTCAGAIQSKARDISAVIAKKTRTDVHLVLICAVSVKNSTRKSD
jgi:hypothetical protein